jgi:hypothetical protein
VFPPEFVRLLKYIKLVCGANTVDTSIESAFVLSRIITPTRARGEVLLQLTTRAISAQLAPGVGMHKNRQSSAFVPIPAPPPVRV